MTIIKFVEHKLHMEGKYKCKCGNRFKRSLNEIWTENPWNHTWQEKGVKGCNEEYTKKMEKNLANKPCPKCGEMCKRIKK